MESDSFFSVAVVEAIVFIHVSHNNPLETSLIHRDSSESNDEKVKDYLMWMDSFGPNKRKYFECLGTCPSRPTPFIESPWILEEKPLPVHLRFILVLLLHCRLSFLLLFHYPRKRNR